MEMSEKIDIKSINKIAINAGKLSMQYYAQKSVETKNKFDNSPVTEADIAVSDYIIKHLEELTPKIPIVSEELSAEVNLKIIKAAPLFWLIDPIDGTWSFIRKNGIFTVNIALINNGNPILGVIYSPLEKTNYYSEIEGNAFKTFEKKTTKIKANKTYFNGYDFLVSSQNLSQTMQDFIGNFSIKTITPIPSSIKFALMAEGKGDIYPRFKPTCIWDTAAGHAILNAAGGEVYDLNHVPLKYNVSIDNPNFIALSSPNLEWVL